MTRRISGLNLYSGYSECVANGHQRSSVHVEMEDGCRIAVDILQPALDGRPIPGPRPTILHATGYRRAYRKDNAALARANLPDGFPHIPDGALITAYDQRPVLKEAIDRGYNVVSMDLRGTGASFGSDPLRYWRAGPDIAQVVDWIAAQPWATDKVGMIGPSWEAGVQLATAPYAPKNLVCIVPQCAPNMINALLYNGLGQVGFMQDWSGVKTIQDTQVQAEPVDGPDGSRLAEEARLEHTETSLVKDAGANPNDRTLDKFIAESRRDSLPGPYPELGPMRDIQDEFERINRSGIAVYMQAGWWDMTLTSDILDFYSALTVPKRLLVGPWAHGTLPNVVIESIRWLDYWLKGIDNGIMDELPIAYSTTDAQGRAEWKAAESWPPRNVGAMALHLDSAPSRTIASAFDGSLSADAGRGGEVNYTVDYEVGLGDRGRLRGMFRDLYLRYPALNERGTRCVTFTGEALAEDLVLTGSPELHVALRTSAADGAITVTLEEVTPSGEAWYITESWLNLEHRKVSRCPRPHAGSAWRSQMPEDVLPVEPDKTMEIVLELMPVSVRVRAGNRLRLTLAGFDVGNLLVPVHDPAPVLTLDLAGAKLVLPTETGAAMVLEQAFAGQDCGFAFDRFDRAA